MTHWPALSPPQTSDLVLFEASLKLLFCEYFQCKMGMFQKVWAAGMLLISEWWASETVVIMGGLLPDPERQLSAMNIYQLTNAMCFMLPLGMAVAVGTR